MPTLATNYELGTVTAIPQETMVEIPGGAGYTQAVEVKRANDEMAIIELGNPIQPLTVNQKLRTGQTVILASGAEQPLVFADHYRLPTLIGLTLAFFVLVAVVAHRQGLASVLGMILSLAVLTFIVVPAILAGISPLLVSLLATALIGSSTIYLAHGWHQRSHLALVAIILTMVVVILLANGAVISAHLSGLGSEEAAYLPFLGTGNVNLRGLLLGGIMLGALGVLDDITTAQVAVVFELAAAKPKIRFAELFQRAYSIGKTHVASLVNTLVLAYAGANLPLFLLFATNQSQPAWVSLNSEIIAEEVVRTLVGSMGLVLAVPLTTALATWVCLHPEIFGPLQRNQAPHPHQH